jgi:hypothetical protein
MSRQIPISDSEIGTWLCLTKILSRTRALPVGRPASGDMMPIVCNRGFRGQFLPDNRNAVPHIRTAVPFESHDSRRGVGHYGDALLIPFVRKGDLIRCQLFTVTRRNVTSRPSAKVGRPSEA